MGQTILLLRVELKYPQLLRTQLLARSFLMCLPLCVEPVFVLMLRPLLVHLGCQMYILLRLETLDR